MEKRGGPTGESRLWGKAQGGWGRHHRLKGAVRGAAAVIMGAVRSGDTTQGVGRGAESRGIKWGAVRCGAGWGLATLQGSAMGCSPGWAGWGTGQWGQ